MLSERRSKIVVTIGPATSHRENLKRAIQSGMNVVRLNFSHGTHADHLSVIVNIRELSHELKAPVAILQDLQGPKIRVGKFKNGFIQLEKGQEVCVTVRDVEGKDGLIPSDFKKLPESCQIGTKILLDDGLLELMVKDVKGEDIICKVIFGGVLKDRKGMNIPGASLSVDCLTPKDLEDLEFGMKNGVDHVALSFVRQGQDIRQLREILNKNDCNARIVAKIEMLEALDNLDEIVNLSDAVMVARGDLAVEVGQARLPQLQKEIIRVANKQGKPVITATQMLDSMVENPRPTRAEITDVANAVLDGSDALMLSAESASGKYPFKCIQTMHEIILEVEKNGCSYYNIDLEDSFLSVPASIGASACLSALKLDATAIVSLTTTGKTARIISGFRPKARVIAITHHIKTLNSLELTWGIQTILIKSYDTMDDAISQIEGALLKNGIVKTGDRILLTLGLPVKKGSKTNTMKMCLIDREDIQQLPVEELPLRCRPESFVN